MGRNIITRHTGRTTVRLTPETDLLNPQAGELKPGDLASVYVTREPGDESYTAAGLLPQNGTEAPPGAVECRPALQREPHAAEREGPGR